MRIIPNRIINQIKEYSLEVRILTITSFLGMIICFASGLFNLIVGLDKVTVIVTTSMGIASMLIFYLVYYKHNYKDPTYIGLVILPTLLYPIMWFYNSGSHGPIAYFYLFNACVCAVLLSRYKYRSIIILHVGAVLGLLYVEYKSTDLTIPYDSLKIRYLDMGFSFTIVFLIIFGLITAIMKEYNKTIDELTLTHEELEQANKKLKYIAETDALTGIYNRRYIMDELNAYVETNQTTSIIMFDIDHFNSINDRFGHSVGDDVICRVSDLLKENIRVIDKLGRIGGEEFVILLKSTDAEQAEVRADKLRKMVSEIEWEFPNLKVTLSGGVYCFKENETVDTIMEQVDLRLYEAKNAGRNIIKSA